MNPSLPAVLKECSTRSAPRAPKRKDVTALKIEKTALRCCTVEKSVTSLNHSIIRTISVGCVEQIDEAQDATRIDTVESASPGNALICSVEGSIAALDHARQRLSADQFCHQRHIARRVCSKKRDASLTGGAVEKTVTSLDERTVG